MLHLRNIFDYFFINQAANFCGDSFMTNSINLPEGNFRGHSKQDVWFEAPDLFLAEVGPGTPCGEYQRRFWMPVAARIWALRFKVTDYCPTVRSSSSSSSSSYTFQDKP